MEPASYGYGRAFFAIRAVLLLGVLVVLLVFLGLQTLTPAVWVAGIGAVVTAYLVIVGLSPLATRHAVTRDGLRLRQGLYFRADIPWEEVEAVGPWEGFPKYGLRLSLAQDTLFVVGSSHGLVSVRLRDPRRFASALFLSAREIVFDVSDRESFLSRLPEGVGPARLPDEDWPALPSR